MICVSVGRGRHRMMIAEMKHLGERGVQLVELRLDYIRRPVNMQRLLAEKPCNILVSIRRPRDGGRWERSEADRLGLLRTCIAAGVDYVDLELDVASQIPRFRDTKRIISYHNFDETPENLEEIRDQMLELDPDILKIVTMANSPLDNFKLMRLSRDAKVPTVAFCMGEMGMPSRILCGKFGSPFTYAAFNTDRQMAPGQLSYRELAKRFGYERIGPTTRVLGVIADPVRHSLSPRIHNACLQADKLDMVYVPFRVPSEHLEAFVDQCRDFGVTGLSVTLPHKEKVLRHITVLDESVVGIRACNTIVFKGEDAIGYNTDCDAALHSLIRELNLSEDDSKPFADVRILILGAGGVARAMGWGLVRGGGRVAICARDFQKADKLAGSLKCKAIDWVSRATHPCDVIINATPVGMHPEVNESPFEIEWFEKHQVAYDAVYNPEQTLFIKQAREAECRTITGVEMFARQAAAQYTLFTGQEGNVDLMQKEVKRATSAAKI